MPPEEQQRMLDLPEGPALFEYFSSIQGSLRFGDVASQMRSLGFPDLPIKTLLGAPMRHRGEHVGNLYVAEKEGGREFTREDEETLVMFASQATMVVVNARRHRDEQRARADLEALINTSPVGVLVFDAATGALASLNREARRIVNDLHTPGRPLEQLLGVLTFRRADGREISLEEFPLAQALSTGETVRAEEIVIQIPDGRSVTTIINATPIHSEEGRVESVVVTLQDMTPLEDLERLRAEFLGMVSHELQSPLASIRGSATTLLDDEPDLDPAEMRQFHRIIEREASRMRGLISTCWTWRASRRARCRSLPDLRRWPVLVDEARNAFLNAGGGNQLLIDLPPDLPWVMADRRRIVQVLGNLLSNAARHSPESSSIRVAAVREDIHVAVSVADEGRGVSAERLPHLFRKFSRTEGEDLGRGLGGSGLGLAICKGIVEAHGGRIWAESDGEGLGARFTFTIPVVVEAGTDAAAGPARRSAPSRRSERGRKRILVVDDDPQALRHVRDALSKLGYAPIVTADPEAVGRLLEAEKPHLVLLDLMLPGTDGIELMKGIFDIADVPVIFLSVYGQDDVIARAFDTGGRRLCGQALLSHGAGGEDQGGPAPTGGRRPARTHGTLCAGRVDHRLRRAQGERCRPSGPVDRHRAPAAGRAIGSRRSGIDPRPSAATGLGPGKLRRLAAAAHRREEPPPQAGRRRGQLQVHLHRAARRLPYGEGRGADRDGGIVDQGALTVPLLPYEFPARLVAVKEITGLRSEGMAGCLGVDPGS